MSEPLRNQYEPREVSPPGETLQEILDERGMSQAELATRMGRPKKTINEIIQGKAAITPETALQLERVLDAPADFWVNREKNYRAFLARRAEEKLLASWSSWVRQFPVRQMVSCRWLEPASDSIERAQHVLQFFGVASPSAWNQSWSDIQGAFRRSAAAKSSWHSIAAWLRAGELTVRDQDLPVFEPSLFESVLQDIRRLTADIPTDYADRVRAMCATAGVAVAFVPEIPRAPISGATRWLSKERPLIQLSLRYKTDDQLWFSFFHEACHILRHGKKQVYIEAITDSVDKDELEADAFSTETLVPTRDYQRFIKTRELFSKEAIRAFAEQVGTSPGVVVGRLQHDRRLPFSHCNDLKVKLAWGSETE